MFGPLFIGVLLSTALWGITCVQTYDYFVTPNEDPRWQKFIVALLFFLDTFDSVLAAHFLYHYLIQSFGNSSALLSPLCLAFIILILHLGVHRVVLYSIVGDSGVDKTLSSFVVRVMFARRVYLVSKKNKILYLWILATSSAHLVVGILIMVQQLLGQKAEGLPSISRLLYISFSLGIVSDASTTGALYWLLHSMKTGIRKTDSLIWVLLLYIVTSCLLVVTDSTLGFIFYIAKPDSLIYLGFYILLGKLYINAFLATLNAREKLGKNQSDVVLSLSRISDRTGTNRHTSVTTYDKLNFGRSDNSMSINVQTSIERRTDGLEVKSC